MTLYIVDFIQILKIRTWENKEDSCLVLHFNTTAIYIKNP